MTLQRNANAYGPVVRMRIGPPQLPPGSTTLPRCVISTSPDPASRVAARAAVLTINPAYGSKVTSICAPDDPICSGGGNIMAHVSYIDAGMTAQAATFAANKINPGAPSV
ncbi:hypothetical protein A5760_11020 [Mycobacterium colombiense]|uniref:Cutinase family protein n=1 Tax=Mycobacterium colombiense TaxID=339268 RepID=A0A1A0VJ13_9MYCO|nr:hypothetical protein A5760_11020 [Mycobacterium colombiense]